MKTRFARLDMTVTVLAFVCYTVLMTAFCVAATARQQLIGDTLALATVTVAVAYLTFEGIRISSPIFNLCAGALLGILLWPVPAFYLMTTVGDSGPTIAVLSESLFVVVLPMSLYGAAFAWAERGLGPRMKWLPRSVVLALLVSATGMAGYAGWYSFAEFARHRHEQKLISHVAAIMGEDTLAELLSPSSRKESAPTGQGAADAQAAESTEELITISVRDKESRKKLLLSATRGEALPVIFAAYENISDARVRSFLLRDLALTYKGTGHQDRILSTLEDQYRNSKKVVDRLEVLSAMLCMHSRHPATQRILEEATRATGDGADDKLMREMAQDVREYLDTGNEKLLQGWLFRREMLRPPTEEDLPSVHRDGNGAAAQ